MMNKIYGLLKPLPDVHTLGINSIKGLLEECHQYVIIANDDVNEALGSIQSDIQQQKVIDWIKQNHITHLGISYRLDPQRASEIIGYLIYALKEANALISDGGNLVRIFFAGLPQSCHLIEARYGNLVSTFTGSQSTKETLLSMGIEADHIPPSLITGSEYDDLLKKIAKEFIATENYTYFKPEKKDGYSEFGTRNDTLIKRLNHYQKYSNLPLIRVHAGPYGENRKEAVELFADWCRQLAKTGYLDICSIGTSQLTQSNFDEDWQDLPNGGGVPIQTPQDYRMIYDSSRPMLLRTYAGTKNVDKLARTHEEAINIAWHALSFWWFNQLDGRGPNDLLTNLHQHMETLKYIAETSKPFEPNIPHHFAFRGSDDVTYIVSAVLAARTARNHGIKDFILQIMLNTPRYTWGIVDLAKARAILQLISPLCDENFRIYLQPRAGLDYFFPQLPLAKEQLATVSMMMDDIEPQIANSPPLIHVVSYSEAMELATPPIIDESIKITLSSLNHIRKLKQTHQVSFQKFEPEITRRKNQFVAETKAILDSIEREIEYPYTAIGLYTIFASGYLPVPYLWGNKQDYPNATHFKTRLIAGSMVVVDDDGLPIAVDKRIDFASRNVEDTLKKARSQTLKMIGKSL
ncbi:MAG: cobalamin-binding protein [Firmicutes bacterium HGW-Firmicutes-10]|nr:MAG: cobalamin-binding protein [Firmicutes bacterium HGW-Firmicutes-10]